MEGCQCSQPDKLNSDLTAPFNQERNNLPKLESAKFGCPNDAGAEPTLAPHCSPAAQSII
jgi:hypothetical protein